MTHTRSLRLAISLAAVALWFADSAAAATQEWIPVNAIWRYLDDGTNQGTAWNQPGFDDSSWLQGPAELGYGDGDEATLVSFGPSAGSKYITTYFRHQFPVVNPASFVALRLDIRRDDGAVVYLNGTEIIRSNLPAFPISYLTQALSSKSGVEETTLYPYILDTALLLPGTNTLAVEVHQKSPSSSDISFALRLRAETTPVLARAPYLQTATPDQVTLRWRTAGVTDGVVQIGASPATLTPAAADPTLSFEHEITVSGLQPDTTYFYSVGSSTQTFAGGDATSKFSTPPVAGTRKPFRLWAIGDAGTGNANAAAVRDAYLNYNSQNPPDVWLMLGDNAYDNGEDAEYQAAVFDMYPSILKGALLWTTRGNHEKSASVYFDTFAMPTTGQAGGVASGTEAYYSFDYANVHFICLDSFGSNRAVGGPMWTWLQADLQTTTQDWIVAFFHHPPYSKGSHDSDAESELIQMRQNFVPVLESGGVDLVLSGHSHSYERSFLMDGHYGVSSTLTSTMIKDNGDGSPASDGPYVKSDIANAGAVFTVAGSSGKTTNAPLNHPAMAHSVKKLGSVILDFDDDQMSAVFLDDMGLVEDSYTLIKLRTEGGLRGDTTTVSASAGGTLQLDLSAGPAHANEPYFMLGSVTAHEPGFNYQGVHVPLVVDFYTQLTLQFANSALLPNFIGNLNPNGDAQASSILPAGLAAPSAVGLTLYYAYLTFDTPGTGLAAFGSNAVPWTIQP